MDIINNRFVLLEEIGKGTFGKVYKSQVLNTDTIVAIKVEI